MMAKLYAELLLGIIVSQYVESIEQAAWLSLNGAGFSKTMPHKRYIWYAIQHAKSMTAADQN